MGLDEYLSTDRGPLWRRVYKWAYTRLLLAVHGDDVRHQLLIDPHLFNARHYLALGDRSQLDVMAIHFNTEVDCRAALTAEDISRLIPEEIK